MKKPLLFLLFIASCFHFVSGQNYIISSDTTLKLRCGQTCTTLQAPAYSGSTSTYSVTQISYNPPCVFDSGTIIPVPVLGGDDYWSRVIYLPFSFCYFGSTYNYLMVQSNGAVSFDTTMVLDAQYPENASYDIAGPAPYAGAQNDLANCILCPYQDLDNTYQGTIYYQVGGTAPYRFFAVSWYNCAMFGDSESFDPSDYCLQDDHQTQMVVLYETTNVIEMYIKQKDVPCDNGPSGVSTGAPWNNGWAIEGLQNSSLSTFIGVPGRNATEWSATNDAWQFSPAGQTGGTTYAWYLDTTLLGSSSSLPICQQTDTTYTLHEAFLACNGTAVTVFDTIRVLLNADTLAPSVVITGDSLFCASSSLSFTANALLGGNSPSYQWQLNSNNVGSGSNTFTDTIPVSGDTISCILTSSLGCASPQTVISNSIIISTLQTPQQPLCLVTYNTAGAGNLVIWNTVNAAATDSFYIYSSTPPYAVYQNIAALPANAPNQFNDVNALSGEASYRYKINLKDNCGNFSALSNYQQTIWLEYLGNGNFKWTPYLIENEASPVNSYSFFRDTVGNGSYQLLAVVPDTQTTITDPGYGQVSDSWYEIIAEPSFSCALQQSISTPYSNTVAIHNPLSLLPLSSGDIRLAPNPAHNQFEVVNTNAANPVQSLTVFDPLGNDLHLNYTFTGPGSITVTLDNVSAGLYFVQLHFASGNEVLKVVKY